MSLEVSEYDKQVCPVCLSPKPANSDACPTCDPEEDAPPSTWTLFKLWRFARPYKKTFAGIRADPALYRRYTHSAVSHDAFNGSRVNSI